MSRERVYECQEKERVTHPLVGRIPVLPPAPEIESTRVWPAVPDARPLVLRVGSIWRCDVRVDGRLGGICVSRVG